MFVEYAKGGPEDILIRIDSVQSRAGTRRLHLLPTLWFRNTWSWGLDERKPRLRQDVSAEVATIKLDHHYYGSRWLYCEGSPELLVHGERNQQEQAFQFARMTLPSSKTASTITSCTG